MVCLHMLIVHHTEQQHQQHRQQQQQSALCWTRSNAINWVKTVFSSSFSSFLSLLRLTACKQTTTRNPLTSCSPDTPEMPTEPIGRVEAGNQSLLIINVIDAWNSIARWRRTSKIRCEKKYAKMTSTMHTSHFTRHSIMMESIGYCFSDCDGRWENAEETVVWNY